MHAVKGQKWLISKMKMAYFGQSHLATLELILKAAIGMKGAKEGKP